MEASAAPQHVLDYLAGNQVLTLATATSSGEPHAASLLYVNDGVSLFIWTKTSTETAAHLQENPRASFTIDEYSDDLGKTKGIQGVGDCIPVTGADMGRVAALFGDKFPDLQAGGSTASVVFYRIEPSDLKFIDTAGTGGQNDEFGFEYKRERVYSSDVQAQGGGQ
jgi:uncharacterized protein YhbP (UPF0306 family)